MSGLDVELEDKNAVGGLDRLVTNLGLAAIAVLPTLAAAIATPWKLAPLVAADEPDGQRGMLLTPGAFLPMGLTVVLLLAAMVTTSETVASNGGAIGPGLAVAVAAAAGEGDLWKTLSLIAPIYFLAVSIAVLAQLLRRPAGDWWTMRTSLRAAFYQVGATVCWIILTSAAIDAYRVSTGNSEMGNLLYRLNSIPIFLLTLWVYFWFFRHGASASYRRSAVLALAMLALSAALILGVNWVLGS
ncbi:MAG: hypothetical protein RLO80_10550 [Hyphomonas sp.]|jgi:hypothetical protein